MPDPRHTLPSRTAVERKIDEAQRDALQLIRQAQISHARAISAIRQIKAISVAAYFEIDELYRTFATLQKQLAAAGDPVYEQHMSDRIGWLLSTSERSIAEIVSVVIREAGAAVTSPKPKETVRESISQPRRPSLWHAVTRNEWVLFFGMLCKGLIQYALFATVLGILFQNPSIAIFVPIATYIFFHEVGFLGWGIIPGVVAFVVWVILLVL